MMTEPTPGRHQEMALIAENTSLAVRLSKRFARGLGTDEDLTQVAMTALFLAARRYDPETGPFRPFAMVTISGELKKHLRDNGWAVRVPRRLQELSITVERVTEVLSQRLGRSPTPDEVGAETGLSVDDVLGALRATQARFGSELPPADASHAAVEEIVDITDRVVVEEAVAHLSPDESTLLEMRYEDELSQREIGERLGISQTQVHRRLRNLHDHLRDYFEERGYRP